MACRKYQRGYEHSRFDISVSKKFHCSICSLVLKDPVMCRSQHYYCSSCIKKHLENSAFCPTCCHTLTVKTLMEAPKIVKEYISELNIRCDFYRRGCLEMVQVSDLNSHVVNCGFSPLQCSNRECNVVVNARDKLRHETGECAFRKLTCHECSQVKNEVKEMKGQMLMSEGQMKKEVKGMKEEIRGEIQNEMKEGMKVMVNRVLVCQDWRENRVFKELKDEAKKLLESEITGLKEDIQCEIKGGMGKIVDQVNVRQHRNQERILDGIKEEVKSQMKCKLERMEDETKSVIRNEVTKRVDENKFMVRQTSERENRMMIEMREEVRSQMKRERRGIGEAMKIELRNMKVEIKDEMKVMTENGIAKMKVEIESELKGIVVRGAMSEVREEGAQATCSSHARENIFVAGGQHSKDGEFVRNKSVECFNWADQSWTMINGPLPEGTSVAFSFLYQGHMFIVGGLDGNLTNLIRCLSLTDPTAGWINFAANLPFKCSSHKVVSYKDKFFLSGGVVQSVPGKKIQHSAAIYKAKLVPPYSRKLLARLPRPRYDHGMEIFDDKLFIIGGCNSGVTSSVVQYDLAKREFKEMPQLPHPICEMATVLWKNHVLVIGGLDASGRILNEVISYDLTSGCSQTLPFMKRKRYGCTAVLSGDVIVVLGGRNENDKYLQSVESFDLKLQIWRDLPDMLEPRAYASAVAKPNC